MVRFIMVLSLLFAACSEDVAPADEAGPSTASTESTEAVVGEDTQTSECADVVAVSADREEGGTFTFHVTVSSPDEGWDKYADEWSVRVPGGATLGIRTLTHPHVDEQPFTRSLGGVEIPEGTMSVVVAARDSILGYCGSEFELSIP